MMKHCNRLLFRDDISQRDNNIKAKEHPWYRRCVFHCDRVQSSELSYSWIRDRREIDGRKKTYR
jgi:hypothetical protein